MIEQIQIKVTAVSRNLSKIQTIFPNIKYKDVVIVTPIHLTLLPQRLKLSCKCDDCNKHYNQSVYRLLEKPFRQQLLF